MAGTNPILDELSGLSPGAQQALMSAHASTVGAPPAAPTPGLQAPSKIPPTPQIGAPPKVASGGLDPHGASENPAAPQPEPALQSPSMGAGPLPSMGTPAAPHVQAPRGTLEGDQNERARLEATGPGITQIHSKIENSEFGQNHPTLGKIAGYGAEIPLRVLEAAGSMFAPVRQAESLLPGTQAHHALEMRNLNSNIGKESEEGLKTAQTGEANARTSNLEQQPELNQAKEQLAEEKQNETEQHHQDQTAATLAQHGYTMENGKMRPLRYEEMSEPQQAVADLKGSQEELADAHAALAKAQKDNIPTQVALAQQRIANAEHNSQIAAGRLGLAGQEFQFRQQQATDKQDQPPAAVQGRAYQGQAIMEAGKSLKDEIDKHRDKIGNLGSYWNQYVNGSPIADPEISGLMARIGSYAALQPALHGFRGAQALAEFSKIIGGVPKNPDALKSLSMQSMTLLESCSGRAPDIHPEAVLLLLPVVRPSAEVEPSHGEV